MDVVGLSVMGTGLLIIGAAVWLGHRVAPSARYVFAGLLLLFAVPWMMADPPSAGAYLLAALAVLGATYLIVAKVI